MYFHGWFEGKVCTERKPKVLEGRKKERRVELEEVIKFAECGVHEPCRGGDEQHISQRQFTWSM